MPWVIEFEGHKYRESDLTIGQAERIEDMTGESWLRIVPLRSAKHARAILVAVHSEAIGESEESITAKVRKMRIKDYLTSYTSEEDDTPDWFENGNPPVADAS